MPTEAELAHQSTVAGAMASAADVAEAQNEIVLSWDLRQLASAIRYCAALGHFYARCNECIDTSRHCTGHHSPGGIIHAVLPRTYTQGEGRRSP